MRFINQIMFHLDITNQVSNAHGSDVTVSNSPMVRVGLESVDPQLSPFEACDSGVLILFFLIFFWTNLHELILENDVLYIIKKYKILFHDPVKTVKHVKTLITRSPYNNNDLASFSKNRRKCEYS